MSADRFTEEVGILHRAYEDVRIALAMLNGFTPSADTAADVAHARGLGADLLARLRSALRTVRLRGQEPERGDGLSFQQLSYSPRGKRRRDEL